MPTTPHYDKIVADLAAGELTDLARAVFDLLKRIPGGCTRLQLIEYCYSTQEASDAVKFGLNNSAEDRKIRKAIEELRENFVPVVSSSGQAGYKLDASPEAVDAMIAEWQSRISHLQERVKKARAYYSIPETIPQRPVQESLFPPVF